jgi:2-(1,2-epoxy-1,2-dihydrophenyl)acetyl-CoA isomerase
MQSILTSVENGVGIIRLNRPDKYNSFNREMALAMQAALDTFSNDASIRCIFISGEGKAFCSGQDLAEAISPDGPGIQKIVREHYNPIIQKIRDAEKPVVCAVNGVAAGAGANLAFACDIAVAGASASFIQAFSKIGLVPDSGGTFFLPRMIGFQRASALMMLGDKVSAYDACSLGMIYKVFYDEQLSAEAMKIAQGLAVMPTRGIALTKKLLNSSMDNSLTKQLEMEEMMQAAAGTTVDYQEGVAAFLEKRKPVFQGK